MRFKVYGWLYEQPTVNQTPVPSLLVKTGFSVDWFLSICHLDLIKYGVGSPDPTLAVFSFNLEIMPNHTSIKTTLGEISDK